MLRLGLVLVLGSLVAWQFGCSDDAGDSATGDTPDVSKTRLAFFAGDGASVAIMEPDGTKRRSIGHPGKLPAGNLQAADEGRYLVAAGGPDYGPRWTFVYPTKGGKTRKIAGSGAVFPETEGTRLLYNLNPLRAGGWKVVLGDLDGRRPERLGKGIIMEAADDLSKAIVGAEEGDGIALLDVEEGSFEQLVPNSSDINDAFILAVSPDWKTAVVRREFSWDRTAVYLIDLETGERLEQRLPGAVVRYDDASNSDDEGIDKAAFSSDGKRLLLGRNTRENGQWTILDLETGEAQRVGRGIEATFVPESNKVLLESASPYYGSGPQTISLVTPGASSFSVARGFSPVVSPDGRYLAFLRDRPKGEEQGYVVFTSRVDGGDKKRVGIGRDPVFFQAP